MSNPVCALPDPSLSPSWGVLIVAGLICGVAGYWLAMRITRPREPEREDTAELMDWRE